MRPDVTVIGGGLAGAAAACRLAGEGRRVVLFERERGPHHKVCGEFVSGEAEGCLAALGLGGLLGRLGAEPIERVGLVAGRRTATSALPFPAVGLSRRSLDARLLVEAERRGVTVRRGAAVQGVTADERGASLRVGGETVAAGAVVLATGKHDLRAQGRPHPSPLIGLKLHLALDLPAQRALRRRVEIVLFPGGYAGLQLVEGAIANLCLVVQKERFAELGRDWRRLVDGVPHLAARLAGARPAWPRPLAVYRIPYGFLHAGGGEGAPTLYRVGDQMAVIPSFTGDGMAMALRSAASAADAILAGRPAGDLHRRLAAAFRQPMRLAGGVARLSAVPALQAHLVELCRVAPGLLAWAAARTRAGALPG